ncbi:LysO family transporter [Acidaminobacter hydrogenoformans]|uniref:DUF340 domain-containing protein n=1 Tax=Acidaminobacter hydrogenoformans DSM 2784 TaxID=1120920 RepID=A0A1G5S2Q4_9FIRM|nr:LysO family transporter [Acidaminobacter hydrogenoformans]SCZ79849.1 Membrane protein of unknown function [Acidaminobacter hydrogenoformans DSM 2784]
MLFKILLYWAFMAIGIYIGIKRKRSSIRWDAREVTFFKWLLTISLALLIFILGVGIGSNHEVVHNLRRIGFSAVLIAMSGLVGSVVFAYAGRKLIGLDRYCQLADKGADNHHD